MRTLTLLLFVAGPAFAADWRDADYGPVLSTHMDASGGDPGGRKVLTDDEQAVHVYRGRLIALNAERTTNLVFDAELMRVAAAWTGGYVNWKGADKNQGPAIDGDILFRTHREPGWSRGDDWADPRDPVEGPLPRDWAHYEGMFLHGREVVLAYTVGDARVLESPTVAGDGSTIVRRFTLGPTNRPLGLLICRGNERVTPAVSAIAGKPPVIERSDGRVRLWIPPLAERTSFVVGIARKNPVLPEAIDLTTLTKGGPRRWEAEITTTIERSDDGGAYVVDDVVLPTDNPWKSSLRFGAIDFFDDGRAALTTWDGDVWVAAGLDGETVSWTRFATGLHQPLGVKIVDGVIHAAARDQITRLHDLNGDGEADWYENFNNDAGLTPQRHEFVMDLWTDTAGNFYYCRSGHYVPSKRGENCCVMRLPPDGSKLEVFARGLREPNGMSIAPAEGPYAGLMTVGDNEGDGIPRTPIYPLAEGDFFGFTKALRKGERETLGEWRKPIVWLPKAVDQSAGGQVWVTSDRWGPLAGHLLHTSYGNCRLLHVMPDRVGDTWQGAAVPFPLTFTSGVMRARFHPGDGQLYLCGLRGWGTSAAKEGQLCRVRYTGKPFRQPLGFRVTTTGVALEFAVPLDVDSATDDQNWAVSVGGVKAKQLDELFVDGIELSKDRRTVTLELEESEPAEMMTIEYNVRAADGTELKETVYATVNAVPES